MDQGTCNGTIIVVIVRSLFSWSAGRVAILVDNLEATDHFRLHVRDMQVDSATVQHANSDVVDLVEAFEYPANEYYVFRSGNSLPKGKYIIALGKNKTVIHLRVAALLNTS